jgi:RNase adaptor protein for sRNA GlmZ degradation
MTGCYNFLNDNEVYKKRISDFKQMGAMAKYIHLYADRKELKKRVVESSRSDFGKLNDPAKLIKILDEADFFTPIPFVDSLRIDNTNLSPSEVANKILEYVDG